GSAEEPHRLGLALPPSALERPPWPHHVGVAVDGRREPRSVGAARAARAPRQPRLSRHVLAGARPSRLLRRRCARRRSPAAKAHLDAGRIHGPRRGREALPVHPARMGGVPRRDARTGYRSRRI
ncbi:MAG: hypothetical protein AVDCRST_MAG69-512, partial [uncultured Solirubrobacteraceae bacterium]